MCLLPFAALWLRVHAQGTMRGGLSCSQPPERGGPPVKQPRPEEAGSAEGAELGALGRGGTPPKKASVRRLDEDALKRSRLHNNQ